MGRAIGVGFSAYPPMLFCLPNRQIDTDEGRRRQVHALTALRGWRGIRKRDRVLFPNLLPDKKKEPKRLGKEGRGGGMGLTRDKCDVCVFMPIRGISLDIPSLFMRFLLLLFLLRLT